MKEIIYNYQLSNHKFDISVLEYNIERLSLKKLLQTQKLTLEFCMKYLLDPKNHAMCDEDKYISIEDILLYQPHISSIISLKEIKTKKEI
jgi:hypothetical protein